MHKPPMANNVSQCVAKENQWSGGSEYELCTKVGGWVPADSQMFLDNALAADGQQR